MRVIIELSLSFKLSMNPTIRFPTRISRLLTVYMVLAGTASLKGNAAYFIFLLWMKTMHYPNTIRYHMVTIVLMAPFTPKSISKLRSALHFRYSIVIPRFISRANTVQS